jgi:UPF0755 protein
MKYTHGKRLPRWRTVWLIVLAVLVVVAGVVVYGIRHTYEQNLKPASASQRIISYTVPKGATTQDIGNGLQSQGLIRAAWAFEWYVRNHNVRDKLQAGTYALRPNQSVGEIVNILTHGKVATNLVTILPGQRLDQIRESLINSAGFTPADVDRALDPAQYADHPALADKPADVSLEGYLYPDSFQKTAETRPETIIRASLDQMAKHLTPDIRDAITQQGLTVQKGVILASIIEQEVSKASDRPTVAQVFLLRLKQNMPLGSDVTAFYGAIMAGQAPSVGYDTPYNTRIHPGLPPGPISNVSDSSLQALAHPSNTDYLYFVAGDDGVTYFSHTLDEHQALTQQQCKKLCE